MRSGTARGRGPPRGATEGKSGAAEWGGEKSESGGVHVIRAEAAAGELMAGLAKISLVWRCGGGELQTDPPPTTSW